MPRFRPPATTEVRWLDADQQSAWRALVVTSEWLQQGLDRQLQRDAGVTHAHYALLVALSEEPGGTMPMSDLARAYDYSLSRLSHAVRRMEMAGWVLRSVSPLDGRVTLVHLTPLGRETIERAAPGHVEYVRKVVIDQFDAKELQQLRTLTTRIAVALAADRDAPDCVKYALGPFED